MRGLVQRFKKDPYIRRVATALVQPLANKDWLGEMDACFQFVRNNIRYTQDIDDVETIQWPTATLQLLHGDCDDMATLLATLLAAIGLKTSFVAIGLTDPGQFDHVYIEAQDPDTADWIAMDPTENNALGWAAPESVCRIDFYN